MSISTEGPLNSARSQRLSTSVALCTYNGARYLQEQLDSINGQTRPPDELVICDDRSTDETREIVERFAATAPFPVTLTVNSTRLGPAQNFAEAISACAGDVIFLCDQDDVWLPEKAERMTQVFEERPDVVLVMCDGEVVESDLTPRGVRIWDALKLTSEDRAAIESGQGMDRFHQAPITPGCTFAFRSTYRRHLLPIPPGWAHDGWILFILASAGRIVALDVPLHLYRQHTGQAAGFRWMHEERSTISQRLMSQRHAELDRGIAYWTDLQDAVLRLDDSDAARDNLRIIETRLAHFRRRRAMQRDLSRLPVILTELCSRRYHRFSNGWRSAARDLLWR